MSETAPSVPHLDFPAQLPVSARRADIAQAIAAHQVIIVCGETGSGKTTQLPKIALAAGRGAAGMIGMTQPRRIAAKSVAHRIAEETRSRLGGLVGWQVRFTDQVGADTRIKVMTDGILLAETQSDPGFRAYDTLILDEAHERSLNIDFLLGYLKTLLPRRPELKLILSSATIEAERFAAWFGGAPVIEVSGRTYPVELRWRPPLPPGDTVGTTAAIPHGGKVPAGRERAPPKGAARGGQASTCPSGTPSPPAPPPEGEGGMEALLAAVDELAAEGPGDILVFLPGEREIREAMEDLRKHHPPHTEILPLFARLSVAEQERVFAPHAGRRIVLATNVAETSLTVPGIRYVVDTGLARVKRYSVRNKIEQLKVEKIAQAAANQRAGRCGRVAAGVCVRLYDAADFNARPAYATPELLRSSLAGVILRMKALRLPDIAEFPFLDPPEPKRVRDGHQLLIELGAIDDAGRLTRVGRELAHLPLDPRIGRMLIAARDAGCLHEALVIAGCLSVQDPRERPLDQQEAADQKHRRFADADSDFIAILNLWRHIDTLNAQRKSQRKYRDALKADFLSPNRAREWRDVYGQLASQVKELGWRVNFPSPVGGGAGGEGGADQAPCGRPPLPASPDGGGVSLAYAPLHQSLLTGLLGNLGMLTEDGAYLGARDLKFALFPGSGVKKKPKWVMAAEIVETRRVYARTLARIEPAWIEHAGRHLLKVSYGDPHWAKKPAHVAAAMRATLYGLPVVNARQVHYGPIDPERARELFIRGALVRGDYDCRAPFFRHNLALLEEIDDLAQRSRNARLAVDEHALYAFFDARIPAGMHNGAAFDKWRREAERADPRLLFLDRAQLLADHNQAAGRGFPPALRHNGADFALAYRFDPGAADDGVTLLVPLAALNQVSPTVCDWLVPGLIEEKITALIKGLPQSIRRNYVPVPDYARAATAALLDADAGPDIPLTDALAAFLARATGHGVPRDAWRPGALPAHLAMNYRVLDEAGKPIAEGRELAALRDRLGLAASRELARAAGRFERDEVRQWDFGDLPETVEVTTGGRRVAAFPALEAVAGRVRLALFDSPAQARRAHRGGVARLVWLAWPELLRQTERGLAQRLKGACLQFALVFKGTACEALVQDVLAAAALSILGEADPPRGGEAFRALLDAARPRLSEAAARVAGIGEDTIAARQRIHQALARAPAAWQAAVRDIQDQMAALVFPGHLAAHPAARLMHLPRYLKAVELRLAKLPNQLARDLGAMNEMAALVHAWRARGERLAAQGQDDPALDDFRWRLEELRVSLFAQELRTPEPVSVKRLEKRWAELAG